MAKVKQADMQYAEAIAQLGYYREELNKRDARIHELETLGKTFLDASTAQAARIAELEAALREILRNANQAASESAEKAYWYLDQIEDRAAAALK